MTDRNYDYMSDDADELKDEIVRLEEELSDLEESVEEQIEAAVEAERERIAEMFRSLHMHNIADVITKQEL